MCNFLFKFCFVQDSNETNSKGSDLPKTQPSNSDDSYDDGDVVS